MGGEGPVLRLQASGTTRCSPTPRLPSTRRSLSPSHSRLNCLPLVCPRPSHSSPPLSLSLPHPHTPPLSPSPSACQVTIQLLGVALAQSSPEELKVKGDSGSCRLQVFWGGGGGIYGALKGLGWRVQGMVLGEGAPVASVVYLQRFLRERKRGRGMALAGDEE